MIIFPWATKQIMTHFKTRKQKAQTKKNTKQQNRCQRARGDSRRKTFHNYSRQAQSCGDKMFGVFLSSFASGGGGWANRFVATKGSLPKTISWPQYGSGEVNCSVATKWFEKNNRKKQTTRRRWTLFRAHVFAASDHAQWEGILLSRFSSYFCENTTLANIAFAFSQAAKETSRLAFSHNIPKHYLSLKAKASIPSPTKLRTKVTVASQPGAGSG